MLVPALSTWNIKWKRIRKIKRKQLLAKGKKKTSFHSQNTIQCAMCVLYIALKHIFHQKSPHPTIQMHNVHSKLKCIQNALLHWNKIRRISLSQPNSEHLSCSEETGPIFPSRTNEIPFSTETKMKEIDRNNTRTERERILWRDRERERNPEHFVRAQVESFLSDFAIRCHVRNFSHRLASFSRLINKQTYQCNRFVSRVEISKKSKKKHYFF